MIVVRPEDIQVYNNTSEIHADIRQNALSGTIQQVIYKGSTVDLVITLPSGKQMTVTEFFNEDDEDLERNIGDQVWMYWPLGWEVILHDEK